MLVGNTRFIYIQIRADNAWGKSFTYDRKRNGPIIEPCGTSYLNVLASEKKHYLYKPSILCLRDRTQTI